MLVLLWIIHPKVFLSNSNPAKKYMFKINNKNTSKRCEIC